MTDALRDVVRQGTAVGSVGSRINFPAGGKTGTTNDGYDVWFIGFTPDLVTGIWLGFDQPKKIKANAQGGVLAAPAWTAMMREVYERRAIPAAWPRPDGLTALDIDKTTGYKATPFCPKDVHYIESFIPGTEPTAFCPIHSPFGAVGGIAAVGPEAAVPRPVDAAAEDFGDALLLPGLINTHTHLELTGLDGGSPEPEFGTWIRRVREVKVARPPEAFLAAARRGL